MKIAVLSFQIDRPLVWIDIGGGMSLKKIQSMLEAITLLMVVRHPSLIDPSRNTQPVFGVEDQKTFLSLGPQKVWAQYMSFSQFEKLTQFFKDWEYQPPIARVAFLTLMEFIRLDQDPASSTARRRRLK